MQPAQKPIAQNIDHVFEVPGESFLATAGRPGPAPAPPKRATPLAKKAK